MAPRTNTADRRRSRLASTLAPLVLLSTFGIMTLTAGPASAQGPCPPPSSQRPCGPPPCPSDGRAANSPDGGNADNDDPVVGVTFEDHTFGQPPNPPPPPPPCTPPSGDNRPYGYNTVA